MVKIDTLSRGDPLNVALTLGEGGGVHPPKILFVILRANGKSGGKILLAVFLTFYWLLNSEKIISISKAVPEL